MLYVHGYKATRVARWSNRRPCVGDCKTELIPRRHIERESVMIRTFDFIPSLQKSEEKRKEIYAMMEQSDDVEYDIYGWHLCFDQNRSIVTITSNGTDECLEWKFIPAEISYKSFRRMLEYNKETDEDNQDDEIEVKFL